MGTLSCLLPCFQRETTLFASLDKEALSKLESTLNPTALRKAKTVYNFGLSECNRVNKPTLRSKAILKMVDLAPRL